MKNLLKFSKILLGLFAVLLFASCEKEIIEPTDPLALQANDDNVTTAEDSTITISVLDNDNGVSPSIASVTQGANGTVTISGDDVVYTPDNGFSGSDSFTYTIEDDLDNNSTAFVYVTVTPSGTTVNTAPTVSGTVNIDGTSTYDIASFLYDADGDAVTVTSITGETNGTVNISGTTVSYTPTNPYFVGSETLTVTVSDGTDSNTGTVTLNYTSDKGETYALIFPSGVDVSFANGDNGISYMNINTNGTITSNSNAAFYNDASSNGTWLIKDDGTFEMTSQYGSVVDYTVSEKTTGDPGLVLVGNYTFQVWN